MTALQLEPSAQAPWTSTIFMCVLLSLVARALLPKVGSAIFTFSEQKRCSSSPEVPALHFLLLLSHQRDLQIGGPVFRLIKCAPVHVLTPIEKHVVVDIDEVVVNIGLALDQAKQRKGFSFEVLHDIDFPRVETLAWKSVRDSGKALM